MKKIMIKIGWICWLAVLVMGCSKGEDNCDPEDRSGPCYNGPGGAGELLLLEERVNGVKELAFEYDQQNRVIVRHVFAKGDGGHFTNTFTYNAKGLMTGMSFYKEGEHVYSEEYVYGSGDRPVSGQLKFDDEVMEIRYSYSGNTVVEDTFNPTREVMEQNKYEFDAAGNPTRITFGIGTMWVTVQELGDYDDKTYRFTSYPWQWKLNSVNNARDYKMFSNGETLMYQDWKYTYNKQGYPIKIEIYNKADSKLFETREYEYINAH